MLYGNELKLFPLVLQTKTVVFYEPSNNKHLQIKKQCLKDGEKWTDPEFGPNDTSLWEGEPKKEIEWKRVHVS